MSGIARSVTEDELRAFAAPLGELFEVKMQKDAASGGNRGYAFVVYCQASDAANALEALNNKELKGRRVRCSLSPAKHRLFVGGLPREGVTKERLERALRRAAVGVESVELPADPASGQTRGFAFVDFYNTAAAEKARRALGGPGATLCGRPVTAGWAEPRAEADGAVAAAVKSVYVTNLPENCAPEVLRQCFTQWGDVERVIIPAVKGGPVGAPQQRARYGFVHFAERAAALAAVDAAATNKPELEGRALECALAKPTQEALNAAASSAPGATALGAAAAAAAQGRGGMGAGGIGPRGGFAHQRAPAPPLPPMPMAMAQMGVPQMGMAMAGGGMQAVPPGYVLGQMMLPTGQVAYVLQPAAGGMPSAGPPQQNYGQQSYGGRTRGGYQARGPGGGGGRNDRYSRPY